MEWDTFFVSSGLRPAILLKKRLWDRYFPMNFAKFLSKFCVNSPKVKISRDPFIFKKFSHSARNNAQMSWKEFFQKKIFFEDLEFLAIRNAKPLIWVTFLGTKNINFIVFFQNWLFNLNTTLTTYFKNLFRKSKKKLSFLSFK